MDHINGIEPYDGGDQGFLMKYWYGDIVCQNPWSFETFLVNSGDKKPKTYLFEADPPILYVLHYGNKTMALVSILWLQIGIWTFFKFFLVMLPMLDGGRCMILCLKTSKNFARYFGETPTLWEDEPIIYLSGINS